MTDRPILFSGPMVRAILDGRKSQTRRVTVQPPPECGINYMLGNESWLPAEQRSPIRRAFEAWGGDLFNSRPEKALCGSFEIVPRHQIGDRLYVREAWHAARSLDRTSPRDIPHDADIEHAATARSYAEIGLKGKLRPGIFLPRWASRLTLIVTDVRVHRLQEISETDAMAEGVERVRYAGDDPRYQGMYGWRAYDKLPDGSEHPHNAAPYSLPTRSFRSLWDSINAERNSGAYAWAANPWVVAISFRAIKQNIDQIEEQAA